MQAEVNVLTLPAQWKANQQAGAGLNNLGNSCYLNSTLQCLAYIPPLAHLCLARGHSASCTRGPGAGPPAPCTFCLVERQLCALLRSPRGASVSPGEVVRHLHLFSRSFVKGRQEDSHELLVAILDVLERDGRRAAVIRGAPKGCRTIVEDLFLGRWQSQVRCLACGHESNTYESFATLPLDIGQARTVLDGLRAFTEAERLDGNNKYRCDRCRQLVPAIKQTTIWDEPNVLVVHLKRFDAGSLLGKITRHVAFHETVDLQPFMTPPDVRRRAEQQHLQQQKQQQHQQEREHEPHKAENGHSGAHHHHHDHARDHQHHHGHELNANGNGNGHHHYHSHHHHNDNDDGPRQRHQKDAEGPEGPPSLQDREGGAGAGRSTYTLTGVLVHQGSSLHSGHYYAFVRDAYDKWSCMNDSQVYGTSLEQVRQEQAYLLFYTRQTMKLPRPTPVPPPAPLPAERPAAIAAAAVSGAAPKPKVYGPQLPLHLRREGPADGEFPVTAAPAPGRGVVSAPAAGPAAANGGPGMVRPVAGPAPAPAPSAVLPARPAARLATPTAKLPAKVTIVPKKAAGSEDRGPQKSALNAEGPAARPVAASALQNGGGGDQQRPSAAAAATAAGTASVSASALGRASSGPASFMASRPSASQSTREGREPSREQQHTGAAGDAVDAAARKRKREAETAEAAPAGGGPGAGATPPSPSSRVRAQVEAETAALKAGSTWVEGVKRLKGEMEEQLRASEWLSKVRACVRSLLQAGMSLPEALACSRLDPRRREVDRSLPKGLLKMGTDELGKMLRPVLLSLGWLGGIMVL